MRHQEAAAAAAAAASKEEACSSQLKERRRLVYIFPSKSVIIVQPGIGERKGEQGEEEKHCAHNTIL